MQSLLIGIGYGLATLFFVGCVVAWWEHLGRARRPRDETDWESPLPKALSVDVSLDELAAEGVDAPERREALGEAISRMSSGNRPVPRWIDTAPMILPGAAADAKPGERRKRDAVATE